MQNKNRSNSSSFGNWTIQSAYKYNTLPSMVIDVDFRWELVFELIQKLNKKEFDDYIVAFIEQQLFQLFICCTF